MPASEPPRRFYKDVATARAEGGVAVTLDGRQARTPAGRPLILPTATLAERLAAEWRGQGETIQYVTMPATRLAHTALDGVARDPTAMVDAIVRYAAADLVCYRAESPAALVRRQREAWDPLLDWAREHLGLVFEPTAGIIHRAQPAETLDRLRTLLADRSEFELAGLSFAAALFGSAVVALGLDAGWLTGAQAFAVARVDETFQEEQWGVDSEAAARAAREASDAKMLEQWFAALR